MPVRMTRSVRVDVDGDRHPAGEDVVDGGAGPGLLDELGQLLRRGFAFGGEPDGDVLVAVADVGVESKDAVEVDVADDRGADLGEPDSAGGGDVGQAGGQTGG